MRKLRTAILFLSVLSCLSAAASSSVTMSALQGNPGDTLTVTVNLNTTDAVSGAELRIPLGSHIRYVSESVLLSASRSNGHSIGASQVGDSLRILIYSMSLATFNGQSGELLRFQVVLGQEPGTYTMSPVIHLSGTDGDGITASVTAGSITILAPKLSIVTQSVNFGHIPIRNSYTESVTLRNTGTAPLNISSILFSEPELSCPLPPTIPAGGEMAVTVTYSPTTYGAITATMNVLSDAINGQQGITITADPFSVNNLTIQPASGASDDTVSIYLTMMNMEPIVGMQCLIKLPEGLEYIPNSFNVTPRGVNHIAGASLSHDSLTLMAYSPDNTPFTNDRDTLCSFQIRLAAASGSYYINLYDLLLVNAAEENMASDRYGNFVDIIAPEIQVAAQLNMGSVPVTDTAEASLVVSNNSSMPLHVSSVLFLSSGYSVTSTLPLTVPAYGTDSIRVAYSPAVEGNFSTTMQIYSNDPESRMTSVNVFGTAYEPNELRASGRLGEDGSYELHIGLDNCSEITALQMDIHWLDSMTTDISRLTLSPRAAGMTPMMSNLGNGTYRVLLFSLGNTPLTGDSGEVMEIRYSGNVEYNHSVITIDNIIASDISGNNKITGGDVQVPVTLYEVSVVCDPLMGSVSGGGIYNAGDVAEISTVPNAGFIFGGWSTGDTAYTIHVTVVSDTVITALYYMTPTALEEMGDEPYSVIACDGAIIVEGEGVVDVCDAAGRLLYHTAHSDMDPVLPVPAPGVYFIRLNGKSWFKVLVR